MVHWFPQWERHVFTYDELIERVAGFTPLSPDDRLREFRKLLSAEQNTEEAQYLLTVDRLREAMVLTAQDIDFCFSELPKTPKNTALSELLHRYLESPLASDRPQAVKELMDRFKSASPETSDLPDVAFVRGEMPSFLFGEVAKSFSGLGRRRPVQEFWTLTAETPQKSTLHFGPSDRALHHLGEVVAARLRDNSAQRILLGFEGSEAERAFLQLKLAALGLKEKEQFWILPLIPYFNAPGISVVGYLGKEALRVKPSPLALTDDEVSQLRAQGIPLSRSYDRIQRTDELWKLARAQGTLLYTAVPITEEKPDLAGLPAFPKAARPDESYAAVLPKKSLSATQLESYARCPTQYLFSNRLKLKRTPLMSEDSFALLFGQAVHLTLENLKKNRQSFSRENLNDEYARSLKELVPELSAHSPLHVLLESRFRAVAYGLEALEKHLSTNFDTAGPELLEAPFELRIDDFVVTGKIDRIERRTDGSLLVLDYKTGMVDFTPAHITQGNHFQALIYLLASEALSPKPCAGFLFYDLKKAELKRGILVEELFPPTVKKVVTRGHLLSSAALENLKSEGLRSLRQTVKNIREGQFPPSPHPSRCDFCDFPSLCRKGAGYA